MRLVDIGGFKAINPEMVSAVIKTQDQGVLIYIHGYDHNPVHSSYSYEETVKKLEGCCSD